MKKELPKKLISFSLWGDDPLYTRGLIRNLELAPVHYPGWSCILYCRDDTDRHYMDEVKALGCQVEVMEQKSGAFEGAFWRFKAAFREGVERFIIRDVDSRLNPREATAVKVWESGTARFHHMRDHVYHTSRILAGMWGGKRFDELEALLTTWTKYDYKGCDQDFLEKSVWNILKSDCLFHDWSPTRSSCGYDVSRVYGIQSEMFPKSDPMDPEVHGKHVGQTLRKNLH